MRRMWRVALIAGLAAVAAGAGEPQAVELVNPSFEEDADKDGVPDGWPPDAAVKQPCRTSLDPAIKKEGRYSFRLESAQPTVGWFKQTFPVEPGALYRASAWVRTENVAAGPRCQGAIHAAFAVRTTALRYLERGKQRSGTTEWEKETLDFIGPPNGKAQVWCFYGDWQQVRGTVWFDGVHVVRLAPPGGVGSPKEPPRGCQALAEWAVRRTPPDWKSVLAALEGFCAFPGRREHRWVVAHLDRLRAAAQADPKLRAGLLEFCAEHGWRLPVGVLEGANARGLLRQARDWAGADPKRADLAASARVGLARCMALVPDSPDDAAAKAVQQTIGNDEATRLRLRDALLDDVSYLMFVRDHTRVRRIYDVLAAVLPADDPMRPGVELRRLKMLLTTGDGEGVRKAAEQLVRKDRGVPTAVRKQAFLALVELDAGAGRQKEAQKWMAAADEHLGGNPASRASFRLAYAKGLAKNGQWDDAATACHRLVASFPQAIGACFDAQKLLVQASMEQRLGDQALAAAKVLYGAAPNSEKEITEAVNLVMQALKQKYRSIALANEFVLFQANGPAGADGKKGTEDDTTDPLAAVQWTPPAEIETLFERTLKDLPEDFAGRRWRGYLYLYWGKPGEALKEFVARYDACPLEQKAIDQCIDDVVVALKAHCGHTLAGEQFMDYQKYGPKGKDGKLGTEDDLQDPIREILKAMR